MRCKLAVFKGFGILLSAYAGIVIRCLLRAGRFACKVFLGGDLLVEDVRSKLAVFHTANGANRLISAGRRTARMRRNGDGYASLDGIVVQCVLGSEYRRERLLSRFADSHRGVFPRPT